VNPARRLLAFFSAAAAVLAAILAMVLPLSSASAQTAPAAGNGVGASHPQTIFTVGVPETVSAVQGRCEAGPQARSVSGLCVAAEDTGSDLADAATCGGESFTAGTKVLLASGLAIPISQLKPGDKVLATNTKTGKTQAEPVSAVLLHHDIDRYDLTVKTTHGTAVIQTTTSHLFWNQTTGSWVKVANLKYGDYLRTSDGATVTVLSGNAPADAAGWMWDLTVPGGNDHDFYIDTAVGSVLVHNCPVGPAESRGNPDSLEDHFAAHGADFGSSSAEDYANQASEFFESGIQEDLPIKIDEEGVIRIYDPETNTFGAYNANGTARTLFSPTSPTYWLRQPGIEPWSP
jgi:hypothetical protein